MSTLPYPAPPGCSAPALGVRATQALGREPSSAVAAHLGVCTACRLQRAAFDGLDGGEALPSSDVRDRLRQFVRERSPTRV